MNPARLLLAASALTLSASLTACVAGPAPEVATPAPVLPATFAYAPDEPTAAALANLLPQDDPAFVALADRAVASGPTLAEALARIEQARAGAARTGAERYPAIGANASVTGTRTNPAQFSSNLPPGVAFDTERVAYAANITARWDPDVFGRLRAQERAAIARLDAADAAARAVRLALVGEIATTVIDWRTLTARRQAIEADLAAATRLADLTGIREEAGIAPGFDRVRAESISDAARSRLAALASERARLVGRLMTLTAQDARTVEAMLEAEAPAPFLSSAPASLPSDLLAGRPDVLAAAATLRAKDAELAATARQRFPSFSLSGAIGLLAYGLGDLFESGSVVGSLAASVAAPLLDFGRIGAEIDGAAAEKKIAFEAYRGAVFTALGDAETAYALVAASDGEAEAAAQQAASLDRAARLASTRYEAGLDSLLAVLDARRAADQSGEQAATAAAPTGCAE